MIQKGTQGFTLIEVIIVIAIIAVLAAIVIIAVNPARQFAQTRNVQRIANVRAILDAVDQYMFDNKGSLPFEVDDNLRLIGTSGSDCEIMCGSGGVIKNYLDVAKKYEFGLVFKFVVTQENYKEDMKEIENLVAERKKELQK